MNKDKMINIGLVDDHEIVRDGIRALLMGNTEIRLTASFPNASEFSAYLKEHPSFFDVLILDISLPNVSGIELTRQLIKENSKMKILMLSASTGKAYIENAFKAGAKGFLPKDCSREELITAIKQVFYKNIYIGKNLEQVVLENYINRLHYTEEEELTSREVEILTGFANGLTYNEIADQLNISKKTIESHKKNIFEKLHFKTNADLIKYAIKHHIIEL
ncbi:response regulator transcription factor [Reichenbachiella sp. MALMAid0571]|uniref:response regulator transcription factor n=1 Tax=Reichenbachiella sp. MALMAid0571 TaxID=3143939 RepID=UPI0032DE44CE